MKPITIRREKGHVLATFGLTIAGLAVVLGLAFQGVQRSSSYIYYENLLQAADAAALAASEEFKPNYLLSTMQAAAQIELDAYDVQPQSWSVETCDSVAADHELNLLDDLAELVVIDPEVCTDPPKKLVRVRVTALVDPQGDPMDVESIAEAPSVDVVLAIDTSDSMVVGWPDAPVTGAFRNPKACNEADPAGADGYPGSCFPFQDVKQAAALFVENLHFPYDRVGVVAFNKHATMQMPLSNNYDLIRSSILDLEVYEGEAKCPYYMSDRPGPRWEHPALNDNDTFAGVINPCRLHNDSVSNAYVYMDCPMFYGLDPDASQCSTTNIGDGVALSGAILTGDYSDTNLPQPWPAARPDALPVLVLLSDGAANAGHDQNGVAICPDDYNRYPIFWDHPLCRDSDVLVRHCWSASQTDCVNAIGTTNIVDQAHYDPDDHARNMFDIVASNHTLTFTIGMGDAQRADQPRYDVNGNSPGETLLKYGAFGTYTHMTNPYAIQGLYYYGNNPSDLNNLFLEIADQFIVDHSIPPTPIPSVSPIPTLTPIPSITPTSTKTKTSTPTPTVTSTPGLTSTPTKTATHQPLHIEIVNPATDGQTITAHTQTSFEAVAWDPDISATNGAGISNVEFSFSGPSSIPSHTEFPPAYCAFGGNTPCPGMGSSAFAALAPGTYTIFATANAADGRMTTVSKTFVIPAAAPTRTPTRTSTAPITATQTATITSTKTVTITSTQTATITSTKTVTITPTRTATITSTKTTTITPTQTATITSTPSQIPTATVASLTFTSIAAQDGWVLESSETSGVGGSTNSTASVFRLGDDASNRQYRAILSFNTSALPDNAIVQSAQLKIQQSGAPVGRNPFNVLTSLWADIRKGPFGGSATLQTKDFNVTASGKKVGAFNNTPVSGWYTNTLNANGLSNINTTGQTQLRLYFGKDDNNNLAENYINFLSGNAAKGQPVLIIIYALAP